MGKEGAAEEAQTAGQNTKHHVAPSEIMTPLQAASSPENSRKRPRSPSDAQTNKKTAKKTAKYTTSTKSKTGKTTSKSPDSTATSDLTHKPTFQYHPAGIYAPDIRLRIKKELDSIPVVPLNAHIIGGMRDQIERTKVCNCRRSNCLKLYCDCFQAALPCTAMCNCVSCKNNSQFSYVRTNAVEATLYRNNHSFRPRVTAMAAAAQEARAPFLHTPSKQRASPVNNTSTPTKMGCNCRKSHCLKLYCECLQACIYCSDRCRCTECQNVKGNQQRERIMAKRRKQEEDKALVAKAVGEQSRRMNRMAMMGEGSRVSTGGAGSTTPSVAGAPTHHSGMPHVEASTALAADAAMSGIDVFLPPSSFVTPMKLPDSGLPWGALGFGMVDHTHRPPTTIPPKTTKKHVLNYRPMPPREPPGRETELEKMWREETEFVGQTFRAIQTKLEEHKDKKQKTDVDPVVDYRSEMTMRNVKRDIRRLTAVVRHGEKVAKRHLAQKDDSKEVQNVGTVVSSLEVTKPEEDIAETKTKSEAMDMNDGVAAAKSSAEDSTASGKRQVFRQEGKGRDNGEAFRVPKNEMQASAEEDVSALLCDEDFLDPSPGRAMSEYAMAQLTMLCAQDAALLRELARIIRQKTAELTERRIRLVTQASGDTSKDKL